MVSKLLDTKVSAGTVSNITKRLDTKVRSFHHRELVDEYQYLFMDAITLKVRYNTRYHNRKVLTVYGVTMFGKKELIDYRQVQGESYEACVSLLDDLYRRGLKGQNLKLVITDGAKGLHAGLDMVYPLVPRQLCWVHKLRNVTNHLPVKYREGCGKQAADIYKASSKHEALTRFKAWRYEWIHLCPQAVECLGRDIDHLLSFFDCPKTHWKKVRTTNAIERSFKEVRRRTNVFSCFSNIASCDRIIYAIFTHLNNNWKDRLLKDFTQFA